MAAIPIPQQTPIERAGWNTDYQGAPGAAASAVGSVPNALMQANDIQAQQAKNNVMTAQAGNEINDLQNKQRSMQLSMLSGILNEPDPDKQRDLIDKLVPIANKINPSFQLDSNIGVPEIRALMQSQKPIENIPSSFLQTPQGQSLPPLMQAGLQSGQISLKDIVSAQASNPFLNVGGASNMPSGQSASPSGAMVEAAKTLNSAPSYEGAISQLPGNMQPTVRAIIEGRESPPNPNSRAPGAQALMQAVNAVDPDFDFTNASKRQSTAKDFASGQAANNVTSLNTLAGHLDKLQQAWSGLDNTAGITPFSNALSSAANQIEAGTGQSGALKSFNIAKSAVSDELSKLLKGGVVSDSEKKEWESAIDNGASPEAQKAALSEIGGIIESRLSALNNRYHEGMGPVNANKDWATPQSKAVFDRLQGRETTQPQNALTQAQGLLKQPQQAQQGSSGLQSGKIVNGFAFKGGDPNDQNNWMKQ